MNKKCCKPRPANCSTGSNRAPPSTCAAAVPAWPPTSNKPSATYSAQPACNSLLNKDASAATCTEPSSLSRHPSRCRSDIFVTITVAIRCLYRSVGAPFLARSAGPENRFRPKGRHLQKGQYNQGHSSLDCERVVSGLIGPGKTAFQPLVR